MRTQSTKIEGVLPACCIAHESQFVTEHKVKGDQRLECFEFTHDGRIGDGKVQRATPRRRRVIKCLFDGFHGSWLPDNYGEEMTWWFMQQHLLL